MGLQWLLFQELGGDVFLLAEVGLAMDVHKLLLAGNLVILVEERVFGFPKLLFEDELAGHKKLAGDEDVEEIGLTVV